MCLDHAKLKSNVQWTIDLSLGHSEQRGIAQRSLLFLIHFLYSFGYEESFASLMFGPAQGLDPSELLLQVLLRAVRTLVRYHLYKHLPNKAQPLVGVWDFRVFQNCNNFFQVSLEPPFEALI